MQERPVQALIAQGRAALERGDVVASRWAYESALAEQENGEAFEGLARACYLAGDYPQSIEVHQRAFAAYREEHDDLGAARAARILAWLQINVHGDWAVSQGWLARAERLLDAASDHTVEHGWRELMQAIREPHGESRARRLRRAVDAGQQLTDANLQFSALAQLGETLVLSGKVDQGMLCFDESLAAVCAGEVQDLYVMESVFCGMFMTCELIHDVARAEQWMRAAEEMILRSRLVPLGALCRSHYGGILTAAGRWKEAETELDQAGRTFERSYAAARAIALVRLADLRVRQGRLEEAEVLLEGLDQIPAAARPLAALRLAQGEFALARDLLERRLTGPAIEAPWPIATTQPPPYPVAAPLLSLLVDVQLAEGAVEEAAASAERLADLVKRRPGHYVAACAALAKAKVCVASGSVEAEAYLRKAVAAFARAQMPIELARARLELAKALANERHEVAVAEAKAALEVFLRQGAAREADAAAALLRALGAPGRPQPRRRAPLTKRESEVLELLGRGLSNPEIATRLFISSKTAEHHVSRILSKLALRNRAEAGAYAARVPEKNWGSK
jgi:DNA-binding NarL/FixJ family response regulator